MVVIDAESSIVGQDDPFRAALASGGSATLFPCDRALVVVSDSGKPRARYASLRIMAGSTEIRNELDLAVGAACPICHRHARTMAASAGSGTGAGGRSKPGGRGRSHRSRGDGTSASSALGPQAALAVLRQHLRDVHGKYWCDVCLAGRQQLLSRQRTYTRDGLADHNTNGDPEQDGVAPIPPHPYCGLCRLGFMHSDELFAHLEREHVACRVCLSAAHA